MWWDAARIEATVTRQFVCSQLLPEEIERLNRPVAFGDGLTDGTYWEWIDEKAKRIFLILLDLGIPDQIFGIIDDSWDDSDLPIALDQVERLELTAAKDERSERKFYYRQFHYLLKPLTKGEHVVYQESEVVPLELVDRRAGGPGSGAGNLAVDKVALPGGPPGHVFCRRRIPIGSGPGCLAHEDFQDEINRVRNLQNKHLVSYFCSYVHQGYGYVLFTPASDASLKTVLAATPASVKALEKEARRQLVMNWIHCLVDTLCYIHSRGLSHGNIKPSTVLFNSDNHISFSDFSRLSTEVLAAAAADQRGTFDKEAYDFAAPEQWFRPSSTLGPGGAIVRKGTLTSLAGTGEGGVGSGGGAVGTFSISRGASDGHHLSSPTAMMHAPNPHLNPQAADVFSLGCIILELLGLLMKRQTRSFAAHRAARHKTPGRGGAVLDSSFHRNLGQVEGWMTSLARDARKKDGAVFRGVTPMLHVVEHMLALHSSERPSIQDVQTRMYQILTESCGISEPHCVHAWGHSLGGLKMSKLSKHGSLSPKQAAAAAAAGTKDGGDDDDDTMSIATSKRSSGSLWRHARPGSSGSRPSCIGVAIGGGGTSRPQTPLLPSPTSYSPQPGPGPGREPPRETPPPALELGSGLQSIRNLQIRDKVRSPWQASPHLADVSV